ncbi:MAG TPA: VWA domain-containing protein, partial [Chloroflexota bacterium]|nr:VWA domain-containing protein [Chloroflexota bacterium]
MPPGFPGLPALPAFDSLRPVLDRLPWRRRPVRDPGEPLHGTAPYAAWEAELTAYARWRTGAGDLKVAFGLCTETGWTEEVRLARPTSRDPRVAFAGAELELEHLLAHYRHGWREVVLGFRAWSQPGEPVLLPWPPWDAISLPPAVVRLAVAEAVPALALPAPAEAWPVRFRTAAAWLVAAWADGRHRALEVAVRPGLAERLPAPPALAAASPAGRAPRLDRRGAWQTLLTRLATPEAPAPEWLPAAVGDPAAAAVERLLGIGPDDLRPLVEDVLAAVEAMRARNGVPPGPEQHPAWLRRDWGRWRRAAALQAALDHLARSPTSVAVAVATAAGRPHALPGGSAAAGGPALRVKDARGARAPDAGPASASRPGAESGDAAAPPTPEEGSGPPETPPRGWGLNQEHALPEAGPAGAGGHVPEREGQGAGGRATGGSGPGALGGLRVVTPTPDDRAAYWQLRGALAPEIERLIERLRAASDAYYSSAPRRFQRNGRLDRNRLAAALAGREAVFSRFVHEPEPANALCLLLDCSASMAPYAEQLREAAILVESAATAVGARVSAFTFGATWERLEPPAEGAPLVALGRELHPHGGTPFGPAVAGAAEWLARQPYAPRRLWVFSDGQWSARDRAGTAWRPDLLKDVLVWVFAPEAPEPPTPAMRIVAARTLPDLIRLAPGYFWEGG